MTNQEFTRVRTMLQNIWPKIPFFDSPDTTDLFFNVLNRYDFRDTWSGIRECVEEAQFQPSLAEIKGYIERAESNRHQDERQNARETWNNAVKCTKCNDVGFLIVTYRKPARDPKYCREDDPYDYTETVRPCTCGVARQKFPTAFMSDDEWQRFVEDQRRKGKGQSSERPGMKPDYYEKECGEVYNIRPGRRPQVFTREKG